MQARAAPVADKDVDCERSPIDGLDALQLLEAVPDAMVIVDKAGTIVYVNRKSEELFGYARDELLGQRIEVLVPEASRKQHQRHRDEYLADPVPRRMGVGYDLFALRRDGLEFPVDIALGPLRVDNEPLISAIVRDITDRKLIEAELHAQRLATLRVLQQRTEELEEAGRKLLAVESMALIGTVAAGLLHDLSNILAPIRSHIEAIRKDEDVKAEVTRHMLVIERGIDYLRDLITRLRSLTKSGTDVGLGPNVTDLGAWWGEVRPLIESVVPSNVTVEAELPPDLPPVAVPHTFLTQVIFNITNNAGAVLRNRPNSHLKVVATEVDEKAGIRLSISDNGPGMSPEVKRRCLEPYFTTRQKTGGSGMGLAIVKSLINKVAGTIEIESEVDRGTTFHIVLPRNDVRVAKTTSTEPS